MAKRKTPTGAEAFKLFESVKQPDEQLDFYNRLMKSAKWLRAYIVSREMKKVLEGFDLAVSVQPRNRGKVARNVIILRLRDEKLSQGQIGKHALVVKANNGRRMNARAVARVLRDAKRKQQ